MSVLLLAVLEQEELTPFWMSQVRTQTNNIQPNAG